MELAWLNAKTAFEFAKDNLEVKAPFNGVISAVNFKENETYSPMNPQGLLRIINNQAIYVEVNVSDNDVKILRTGQNARITVNNIMYDGYISFISPENNMMSGLNRIKIEFPRYYPELRHNQFANVELIPEQKNNVLIIPKTALLNDDSVIIVENNHAKHKTVKTGMESRLMIEIVEGLKENDVVITEGNSGLENDYPVMEFSN
jgi:RND family efflux transporter MFP subunit